MIRIKDFICPHNRDEIFCLRQINDVVGLSRQHLYRLDAIPAHFKFDHFIRADLPLPNQAMTGHHDEKLPFAIVPVLPLRDARLGNVHAELTVVCGLQPFRKASSQRNRWESPA